MKINYKKLSNGYIGLPCTKSTLNSSYYYYLFDELNNSSLDLSNLIIFPQRIPRSGFFDELYNLETSDFKNHFDKKINLIERNYKNALDKLNQNQSEQNSRTFLNWSYILSRYGRFEKIKKDFPKNYPDSFSLEINLLKELNQIQILLSNDEKVSVDGLLSLCRNHLSKKNTGDREKIILLNQTIVNFYRHQKNSSYENYIFEIAKKLLVLIENFQSTPFLQRLYSSIAYRGLAMVHQFGHTMQTELLAKAELHARDLKGNSKIEKIVAADNLNTCLQSMSKWQFYINDLKKSEDYLLEMIGTDPADSIAYSELGFFYIKTELYKNAIVYFKKALKLGPPGAGMNAYYYAKCLEKIGDEKNALALLYKSAELDNKAISPWLDLMNHFIEKNIPNKAIKIAKYIFQTPILMEQLEKDETITIQNLIK